MPGAFAGLCHVCEQTRGRVRSRLMIEPMQPYGSQEDLEKIARERPRGLRQPQPATALSGEAQGGPGRGGSQAPWEVLNYLWTLGEEFKKNTIE
jgi:hypothetical protein